MTLVLFVLWLASLGLMIAALVKRKSLEANKFWGAMALPTIIFILFAISIPRSPELVKEPTHQGQVTPGTSEEPSPEPTEPEMTSDQKNAIQEAESYLTYSDFSRKGLIRQLKYEGFSEDDATFAVDYLNVDWNEQAVLTAKGYLEYSSFSRKGLIDQLKYEGFTTEQAEYGVKQAY